MSKRRRYSISTALEWGQNFLRARRIVNARLSAELLMVHLLKCNRVDLYRDAHKSLIPKKFSSFKNLIKKLTQSWPLAYLTGRQEFMSLEFMVTRGVLIPRPETEFLVAESLRIIKDIYTNRDIKIIDLGTGCGNIAISLVRWSDNKRLKVFASEISLRALKIARKNTRFHKATRQITFLRGNLFKAFKRLKLEGEIDLVVSNPPYVSRHQFPKLPLGVRKFEPRTALFAGSDGTEFHKSIITESARYLKPSGYLVLEIGYQQADDVKEFLARSGYFDNIHVIKDYLRIERVITARRKG